MSKKLELASIGLKCLDIKLELRNASRQQGQYWLVSKPISWIVIVDR